MTLSDLWPGFQGHAIFEIFEIEYRKNGVSFLPSVFIARTLRYKKHAAQTGCLRLVSV